MKPVNLLRNIFFSAIFMLSVSCNTGGDKKDSQSAKDSMAAAAAAKPPAAQEFMTIKHKLANYAKWKPMYDADDSARMANGLHNYVIARGVDDSNMVLVAVHMDDVIKATAFAANPALKEVMKKAGVMGAPETDYLHSVMNDTTAIQQTIRVMIKHRVKDFAVWKKSFDEHKPARMEAGLTDRVIAYTIGDDHQVTLVFAVADLAKAKAFSESKALADRMKAAGVEGPPSVFYYRIVQKY